MIFARIITCVVAFAFLGAADLSAQSLGDVLSQTGRVLSKTVRSAERALTKSTSKWGKAEQHQQEENLRDLALAPPLPERRPRPWELETQFSQPLQSRSADGHAMAQPVAQTIQQPTNKIVSGKNNSRIPHQAKKTVSQKVSEPHVPKSAAKSTEAPQTDTWSPVEINVAQARCRLLLKQVDAVTISQPAIKKGPCGDAAPVKLVSIGRSPEVAISPPAVVNCQMVHMLHTWLEEDLQPLAKKHLGAPIVTIETMSSYSCRNAYGRTSTRLSEHGRANALDIGGFLTANGKRTRLLAHWGPNHRDITAAKKKAQEKTRRAMLKKQKASQLAEKATEKQSKQEQGSVAKNTSSPPKVHKISLETAESGVPLPVRGTLIEGVGEKANKNRHVQTATIEKTGHSSARLGGPKLNKSENGKAASQKRGQVSSLAIETPAPTLRPSNTKQARFLRAAHKTGCAKFGTVLGPEANEAHRNHFHVDLAPRKHGNYCR